MAKPNIPNITFMKYAEGYEDISTNPLDYEGKNVLIMGKYYQGMLQRNIANLPTLFKGI